MTPRLIVLGLAAGALLAGCGKMGNLDRPAPMFSKDSTTAGSEAANRRATDPDTGPDTVSIRDRNTDPAPPRSLPIEGAGQDPFAVAPQGALPDPYARQR